MRAVPGLLLLALLLGTCVSLESLAQGIVGTVRNTYEPEQGVRIELFVDGLLVDSTLSAEDGSYNFTGVPDGAVALVYSLPGLATVTVQPGNYVYPQTYRMDALMLAALGTGESFSVAERLVLTVVDAETGEPLGGRTIRLAGFGVFLTDRLGRYTFFDFPRGEQRLEFHADGYEALVIHENVVEIYNRVIVRLHPERPKR